VVGFVDLLTIVGFGERRFKMPQWMMGVGIVLVLIAPCLIAMRTGVEDSDESKEEGISILSD
jgi:hypothetical protein